MDQTDWIARGSRRSLVAGVASLLLGFPLLFAALAYISIVYLNPSAGWFVQMVSLFGMLSLAFLGACIVSIATMRFVDLVTSLQAGGFACPRCGYVRWRFGATCPCVRAEFPPRKRRHWVHYRRRIKAVLLTYVTILALVLIAFALHPLPCRNVALDIVMVHSVLCVLLAVLIEILNDVLKMLKRGGRWRLRSTVFQRVLLAWPALTFIPMLLFL